MNTTDPHPARIHLIFTDRDNEGTDEPVKCIIESEACSLSEGWVHSEDTEGRRESWPREHVLVVEWADFSADRAGTDPEQTVGEAEAILREREMPLPLSPIRRRGHLALLPEGADDGE